MFRALKVRGRPCFETFFNLVLKVEVLVHLKHNDAPYFSNIYMSFLILKVHLKPFDG